MNGKKRKDNNKVMKSLIMVTQIGISMMVPIFLCAGLGWILDQKFQTQIWMLLMMVLGIAAAFRSVYGITKSFYAKDMEKEHEKLKYMEDLRNYSTNHIAEDNHYEEDSVYHSRRDLGKKNEKNREE